MSDELLQEYKAYYNTRANRYKNNPKYQNLYQAEKKLADAMDSCNELIEFKDKIGNLNEDCAIALVKDESIIERDHFDKHKEVVRIKAPERILEKLSTVNNAMDVGKLVTDETNKNSIEISMDEANRQFHSDWKRLDDIEVYENAEVPDKYKSDLQRYVEQIKNDLKEGVEDLEENNSHWQEGWRLTPDIIFEYRHRRLLPYKDEHVQEQLAKYKQIVNR